MMFITVEHWELHRRSEHCLDVQLVSSCVWLVCGQCSHHGIALGIQNTDTWNSLGPYRTQTHGIALGIQNTDTWNSLGHTEHRHME